ncbi:MAG: 50S ribosomal protein L6, partial [Bdellovibrionales bacterium]|nr:50S ribosomal protein L6 [Bdellovibrionales bacterium]
MSRVGRAPIFVDDSVKVAIEGGTVAVKGPKHALSIELQPSITATFADGQVVLTRENDEPKNRAFHGLYRALIQNAVTGVSKGWNKSLILNGVGYRASVSGKKLTLVLGYSH